MLDVLFTATFLLFPFLFYLSFKCFGIDLIKITLINFVLWNMLLSAYLGIFVLFFGLDEYRVNIGVDDQWLVLHVFLCAILAMTLLGGGIVVGRKLFDGREQNYSISTALNMRSYLLIFVLGGICLAVLLKYLAQLDSIALLVALTGDGDAKMARSAMGNDFQGKYHWYRLFFKDIALLLLFVVFADLLFKRNKINIFLFGLLFCTTSFGALMATEKGPFAWMLVALFLTYVLKRKNRRINLKSVVFIITASAIALGLMYVVFMGSGNPFIGVIHAIGRVTAGSIQPAYHYLEVEKEFGLLYGQTMPNPRGLLPFEPLSLSKEVWVMRFPYLAAKGYVGSVPTVYWAEMYMNFSYLGIAISSFLVGFFLSLIQWAISLLPVSPVVAGLEVWLLMHYKELANTGVGGFIVDMELFFILCCSGLLIVISRRSRAGYLRAGNGCLS